MVKSKYRIIGAILSLLVLAGGVLPAFMPEPVHAATGTFYTDAGDGEIYGGDNVVYLTTRDAVTGTKDDVTAQTIVGQYLIAANYNVYRSYFYFDTSAIPDCASITAADFVFYCEIDESTAVDFDVTIQNGQPGHPEDPLVAGDYDKDWYAGDGGSLTTLGINTGCVGNENTIAMNAAGRGWISKTGITKLMLRSSRDIGSNVPTGREFLRLYANEAGSTCRAYLYVTWDCDVPTVTTSNATAVEETTATLHGDITNTGTPAVCDNRGFVWDTVSRVDPGNVAPPATYADSWTEAGAWGVGAYTRGIAALTSADAYYSRSEADQCCGYDYSNTEIAFMTKPWQPTAFTCTSVNSTCIQLDWTEATSGAGTTIKTWVQAKEDAYPANRADGANIYYGTDEAYTHCGLGAGEHWYYRIWSSAEDGGLFQWSDTYDECESWTSQLTTVLTLPCTGVGNDWAVLNGYVDYIPGALTITQYGFDYGLTTGYGSEYTVVGGLDAGDSFWLALRELSPATLYHCRAKVYTGTWATGGDVIFATKGSPSVWEYLNTGCDGDSDDIYADQWGYQTFTTNTTAHSVNSVRLNLRRVLTPGTVTLSIRHATAADGDPTGLDLAVAYLDGDDFSAAYTWYQFDFADPISLEGGLPYALVLRALSGDNANYIEWCIDSGGGIADAEHGHSINGGVTWASDAPEDALFEIWGYASLIVHDAKVFTDYLEDGDWLICANTENTFPPYYNEHQDPSAWFYLQLVDDTNTIRAAVPVRYWERQPLAIYVSADTASSFTWGADYLVRVRLLTAGAYQEYPLEDVDWRGNLDFWQMQWIRLTAKDLEEYYGEVYLVDTADRGLILNEDGSVLFQRGIPAIMTVLPDMFEVAITTPGQDAETFTQAGQAALVWETQTGAYLAGQLNTFGGVFGITGAEILGGFLIILWLVAAASLLGTGHGTAALLCGIPFVFVGVWLGVIGLALVGVFAAVLVVMVVRAIWTQGG